MTEYDYSPEAYERYLATQNRIANWVDQTEQHRPQFEHAVQTGPPAGPPMRPGHMSYDSHRKLSKRSPPASPTHHYPPQMQQMQQPRQLFIHPPAPESESSDDYGDGPGPMPLPSPGMMFPHQHPGFHPMAQPMMSPPPMMMPPTYMTAPHHKSSHRHRSSHSHSRSRSQHSPVYYSLASPPVSPGYQYAFPQMMGGGHPGYIMMQPQHHHTGNQSDLSQPPRSAPANVTTFSGPPADQVSDGYFQPHPNGAGPRSTFIFPGSAPLLPPEMDWSYGVASPSHSVMSSPTGVVNMTSNSTPHYFTGIPQYQGIHSAMASPTYLPSQSQPAEPFFVPQSLHKRVYDSSTGSSSKHYLRRSVG